MKGIRVHMELENLIYHKHSIICLWQCRWDHEVVRSVNGKNHLKIKLTANMEINKSFAKSHKAFHLFYLELIGGINKSFETLNPFFLEPLGFYSSLKKLSVLW